MQVDASWVNCIWYSNKTLSQLQIRCSEKVCIVDKCQSLVTFLSLASYVHCKPLKTGGKLHFYSEKAVL